MPDYQQGKIYKITSGNLTYIGSTCRTLEQRLKSHQSEYKQWKAGKRSHIYSYDVLDTGSYIITLIETYPCNSKNDLLSRERFYIETSICINKNIPLRTTKEWYEINRLSKIEYQKKYRDKNKVKLAENRRKRRALNTVKDTVKISLG